MFIKVSRKTDGSVLANQVRVAKTFWSRFRGLMLVAHLAPGEGLLIEPCTSIHMMFMRMPIDVVFLSQVNLVVGLYKRLRPWVGFSSWHRDACKVLELPAGTLEVSPLEFGEELILELLIAS